jgi:hypothetical protein
MKKTLKKIKAFQKATKFVQIKREVSKSIRLVNSGYILDHTKDFVVVQECEDFRLLGYLILPTAQIKKVQHKKTDAYYDKIMEKEGMKDQVFLNTTLDLKNWKSIFKIFQNLKKPIIIECEGAAYNSFSIGPITQVNANSVEILHFDAMGKVAKSSTQIAFEDITCVQFDDRYIDVFYKYAQ